jgi:hypothetical protein
VFFDKPSRDATPRQAPAARDPRATQRDGRVARGRDGADEPHLPISAGRGRVMVAAHPEPIRSPERVEHTAASVEPTTAPFPVRTGSWRSSCGRRFWRDPRHGPPPVSLARPAQPLDPAPEPSPSSIVREAHVPAGGRAACQRRRLRRSSSIHADQLRGPELLEVAQRWHVPGRWFPAQVGPPQLKRARCAQVVNRGA